MDSSIASLFDDDDVEDVPRRQKTPHSDDEDARSPRPSKRRRQTVNLASDDEDAAGVMAPRDVDMRAMEELGDMDEDIQWEGADKMEQQIAARVKHNPLPPALTPHAILPSSSPPPEGAENSEKKGKGEKKPRRKPLVLKEGLLTGDNGFPKLISDMKQFKPKGKGHEASDLNRLLQVYQFWTHQLYPKAPFRETVTRIEKLCHTKMMLSSLSRWKDEAKGIVTPLDGGDHSDDSGDDEDEDAAPARSTGAESTGTGSEPQSEDDAMSNAPGPSRPPSRPPTSASEREFDDGDLYDEDLEALMQEDRSPRPPTPASAPSSQPPEEIAMDLLDDDSLWETFDDPEANNIPTNIPTPAPATAPTAVPAIQADDPMDWDALDEMEDFDIPSSKPPQNAATQPQTNVPQPQPPVVEEEDDDDMYV